MLTQEYLKSVLHYSPETGIFTNLTDRCGRARKGVTAGYIAQGYTRITIDSIKYKASRLAWLYVHGEWPNEIDHINGKTADDRLINLRACNRMQNMRNVKTKSDNVSGYKGVHFCNTTSKYIARIRLDGQRLYLGSWGTAEEAHYAYKNACAALSGEFSVYSRPS